MAAKSAKSAKAKVEQYTDFVVSGVISFDAAYAEIRRDRREVTPEEQLVGSIVRSVLENRIVTCGVCGSRDIVADEKVFHADR